MKYRNHGERIFAFGITIIPGEVIDTGVEPFASLPPDRLSYFTKRMPVEKTTADRGIVEVDGEAKTGSFAGASEETVEDEIEGWTKQDYIEEIKLLNPDAKNLQPMKKAELEIMFRRLANGEE